MRHIHNWHDMYKINMISEVHDPILLITPLCLEIPPLFLEPPLTYLEVPPLAWCDSRPLRSLVGCILTPPPFPPHSLFPFPNGTHFKYMPSYDNITISTSHSPIQLLPTKRGSDTIRCCVLCGIYVFTLRIECLPSKNCLN